MTRQATKTEPFADENVRQALRAWWTELDDRRGERAHLRRCGSAEETLAQEGTERLRRALAKNRFFPSRERIGPVAGLLAHVKADQPEAPSLGRRMAEPVAEGGRPVVSELRFRRLLRLTEREDLYPQMVRVLRQLDGHVSVGALARDVYYWNERTRYDWARDYYAQTLRHDGVEQVAEQASLPLVVQAWWAATQEDHGDERAVLRRCSTLSEVRLTKGFHRLRRYVERAKLNENDRRLNDRQLAPVAGLLAHIKTNRSEDAFAMQMALPKKYADPNVKRPNPPPGRARLSGLRFRRLLQITDRDDLYRALIRVIHHLDQKANVQDIAQDVYWWGKKVRRRWAEDYYTTAPKDEV